MISDKRLQKLIDDCSEAFVGASSKKDVVEPGLYAEWLESHQLQIKKACRLIGLAKNLIDEKTRVGTQQYYTTAIESCFVAMERTVEAYLLETKVISDDDFISHEKMFEFGATTGIYTKETGEMLISLWNLNRSNVYYRRGLPTKDAAEGMVSLAVSLHNHVLGLNKNLKKECIC
ncbi:MAG: hypothetical protein QMC80_01125 [Thermoplasmatales archaeon]|nr:hypothetical protein [Thermoplasmatales archaeon]